MPMRGDRYVIEIDGPYYKEQGGERGPFWKVCGLNAFFTENDLKKLRKQKHGDDILIGDEVEISTTGERFFVTKIQPVEDVDTCWFRVFGINQNGETYITPGRYVKKTGHKNLSIEEMFG